MKKIEIKINCGKDTCASKPGEFCQFLGSTKLGTVWICRLFPSDDNCYTVLNEKEGWLQRCDSCIKEEIK